MAKAETRTTNLHVETAKKGPVRLPTGGGGLGTLEASLDSVRLTPESEPLGSYQRRHDPYSVPRRLTLVIVLPVL